VVALVTNALENSEPENAALAMSGFLDDLSNWYVRRSRRRFWKSEHDADKNEAYSTLWHVLVKFARLLAPVTPFITEVMYQNLVCSVFPQAHASVHHTLWPQQDAAAVDPALLDEMALARQVASLGLSARNEAGLKVRQPLAKALAYAGGKRTLRPELVVIVVDELNVKAFEFVEQASQLVTYRLQPDNKLLGPRFGAQFPALRAALAAADPARVAAAVQTGLPVELEVAGQAVQLAPGEILVQTQPVAGLAVASDKQITVGVDAVVTPDLRAEGLAREVVRRVQDLRKQAGFDIADRIYLYVSASPALAQAVQTHRAYVMNETLSLDLLASEPPQDMTSVTVSLEGEQLTLGVRKA
jgi:isoleucyl-tRNA synthetase